MNKRSRLFSIAAGSLLLAHPESARAQTVAGSGTGTGPSNPAQGTAPGAVEAGGQRIIIEDTPLEQSVLPTVRPYTSAYGLESNILDVPRNVTIISREQLDTISIQDVRDFSKLTSSSYTTTNFGAPANPSIRGQSSDVFTNGLRTGITSNGNGLPIDFNAVESVSILKGPSPVVYGPSPYVGGFINFVTKRPYFDKFQGAASTTIGQYDQYRWSLDFGGPIIKDKLAYRVSYAGEGSGSYYENGHKNTEAVYVALTYVPTSWYTAEFNTEFFYADYTENFGINRPTQDLIDHGRYITGTPLNPATGAVLPYPGGVEAGFNFIPTGQTVDFFGSNDSGRRRRLLAPGDGSLGRSDTTELIQTARINDHISLVNSTLGLIIDRKTVSSYRYSEIEPNNVAIENRTELKLNYDIPIGGGGPPRVTPAGKDKDGDAKKAVVEPKKPFVIGNQINFGFDFRYQHIVGANDFYHEPANAYDLTQSRNLTRFPGQKITTGFNASIPVLGGSAYATPGGNYGFDPRTGNIYNAGPDTNDSFTYDYALFFQHQIKFGDKFDLLYGGRGDLLVVNFSDPAAPPGFAKQFADNTVMGLGNFNVSPTFHIAEKVTTYFTYNYNQATQQFNGGGIAPADGSSNFSSAQFHNKSELFEIGAKASLLKDTLFLNAAAFRQTRNIPQQGGANNEVNVKGIEVEANYQPNRYFYATAGYTFLSSYFYNNSSLFTVTGTPVNVGTTTITDANGNPVTGKFTPTFVTLPNGNYRQPGLPQHLFNYVVTYKTPFGLGASLDGNVTSTIFNDYNGYLRIPWQYSIDATLFYNYKNFEVRLAFLNLTNQKNWAPPNPTYGNDSILADLPFRMEGSVKIKF